MPLATREFWKRAIAAGMLSRERARELHEEFRRTSGTSVPTAEDCLPLARWLVAQGVLERDQARRLLSGTAPHPARPETSPAPRAAEPAESEAWRPPEGVTRPIPGRRRPSAVALIGSVVGVGLVAAIIIAAVSLSKSSSTADRAVPAPTDQLATTDQPTAEPVADESTSPPAASAPPAAAAGAVREIEDDGRTLWISPTAGKPLVLDGLPSGIQVLLVLRLAELDALEEGRRTLDALGPDATAALDGLVRVIGLERSEIEQLMIAFVPDESGAPRMALVAQSRAPLDPAGLSARWRDAKQFDHQGKTYYSAGGWSYYLPPGSNRVAASTSRELVKQVIEQEGPPVLRGGFERLLRASDDARHATLLAAPAYLATDGQSLFTGDLERLREPQSQLLDVRTEAVMLSGHLGERLFLELRTASPVEVKPEVAAAQLTAKLTAATDDLERYVASLDAAPYGRLAINRLSRMIQLLADYTRTGAEDKLAVLRAYLPLAAAHNLVLAGQLLLAERGGTATAAATASPARSAAGPNAAGAQAALARQVSLSFPRDTLERSLELLAREIEVPIIILGSDLQLEGITKNQSFALELRDRPAGEVLSEILRLANPDRKLVYVIRPEDGVETIFVTTRAAATRRGEKLPPVPAEAEK